MELTSWLLLLLVCCSVLRNLAFEDLSHKTSIERCPNQRHKKNERNSYLWKLKKYPSVFIFGSIHRPYSTVWPMIPRNVKRAFKSSEKVYFEIDLTSIRYLLTIAKCQLLPNKQTLSSVLPEDIFQKLQRHLDFVRSQIPSWLADGKRNHGHSSDKVFREMTMNWKRKRPIWMMLQLTSLNKYDIRTNGMHSLDFYLFSKARKAGKEIGSIESAEEHCGLNSINTTQAINYLNHVLTKYNLAREGKISLPDAYDLTYHYLCGNLSDIMFSSKNLIINSTLISSQDLRDFEKSLTQELLVKRNKNMADKIIQEIRNVDPNGGKRMFFTIGAGHLIGKGGIIDILEAKGFKTRHLKNTNYKTRLTKLSVLKDKRKKAKRKTWKMSQSESKLRKHFRSPCVHSTQSSSSKDTMWTTKRLIVRSASVEVTVNHMQIIIYVVLVLFKLTI